MFKFDPDRKLKRTIKTLQKRVRILKKSAAEQVMQSAQLAGAREIVKKAKSQLPSGYKYLSRGIRARAVRRKKKKQRVVKVGFGVGMSRDKQDSIVRKKKNKPAIRGKGAGVGISIRNIHWKVLGLKTQQRQHKSGHKTGTHGADPKFKNFMHRAAIASRSRVSRAMRKVGGAKLKKQVAKIKQKAR